jgi:hypothetical protein
MTNERKNTIALIIVFILIMMFDNVSDNPEVQKVLNHSTKK